jgi:hypothetical protein
MGNPPQGRLADIAEIVMGQSPEGEACNTAGKGMPLLNGPTEFGGHHPTPVQYTSDARKLAAKGDILFCVRGSTTGKMNWADRPYAIGRGLAAIRPKHGIDTAHYVRAVIEAGLSQLLQAATGSTFPNVSREQLLGIPCRVLGVSEQKRISGILGALDDKIELNRKMNETLEQMAKALFKSWFVDFDPVHAKAAGRKLAGMDKATADLFPDSFVDSELGNIPKGWKVGKLGEFMQLGIGGAWGEDQSSSKADLPVSCLRGIDCHALAERLLPEIPVRYISTRQFEARRLKEGCLLIEGSGSFCGRSMIWLNGFERLLERPACYSNFCKRLDPLCSTSQSLAIWMQMRSANDNGELANYRTGTAFPNFDINGALLGMDIVMPSKECCDSFMKIYQGWLRLDLVKESQNLSDLRDTLLPRLLNAPAISAA